MIFYRGAYADQITLPTGCPLALPASRTLSTPGIWAAIPPPGSCQSKARPTVKPKPTNWYKNPDQNTNTAHALLSLEYTFYKGLTDLQKALVRNISSFAWTRCETGSHATQTGLKFAMHLRMTLNSCSSCLTSQVLGLEDWATTLCSKKIPSMLISCSRFWILYILLKKTLR